MSQTIKCPKCQTTIEITEVMSAALARDIRAELETKLALHEAELNATAEQLAQDRLALEDARNTVQQQVKAGIEVVRERIRREADEEARADLVVEIKDRDERLIEVQQKLTHSQSNELELRKRERELVSQKEQLELDVARQLDLERDIIRTSAMQQFSEQHQLKDAEKEKQIADMRRQIDELKRRAEQGSQQAQGEVQELALEDSLSTAFPTDTIAPVPKGVNGVDALHRVLSPTSQDCGSILWESKRTKSWNNAWLAKLREDQRKSKATFAVIVSEVLPENVHTIALIEGIWVCSRSCIIGLATALRTGLVELAKSRLAAEGRHEKTELVYSYLSGAEFQHRVSGIVESFVTLHHDLAAERRSTQRLWAKREKQIEKAVASTAGLYGDFQGIIGVSLPELEGLATTRISEADDMTTNGSSKLLHDSDLAPELSPANAALAGNPQN